MELTCALVAHHPTYKMQQVFPLKEMLVYLKHVVRMQPSQSASPLSALFDNALLFAGGMSGYLLPPEGDPCPTVVPTPFGTLGDDIGANATCSAFYANPRHQKHISRPLEGQGFEV